MEKSSWPNPAVADFLEDAAQGLKSCPLCEALNARSNDECFVCGWHGEFKDDRESIEDGLIAMMNRFPELIESYVPAKPPTFRQRIATWWRRVSSRA